MALTESQFRELERRMIENAGPSSALHSAPPARLSRALPAEQHYKSKTEALFAQWLDLQVRAGAVGLWLYEAERMRLAAGKTYVPDFMIIGTDGRFDHWAEVKGRKGAAFYSRDLGKLKVSVAAVLRPWWKFKVYWPGDRGEWQSWEVPSK